FRALECFRRPARRVHRHSACGRAHSRAALRSSPVMRRGSVHRALRAAALGLGLALALAGRAAANCGAEGCPLSPKGLEGAGRRWTLDIGYQYVAQDVLWDGTAEATGPAPVGHVTELYTKTSTYAVNFRARVLRSLEITGSLPYIQRQHAHEIQHHPGYFVPSFWKYEGLGDALFMASWAAFGTVQSGAGGFSIQAGGKLPPGVC